MKTILILALMTIGFSKVYGRTDESCPKLSGTYVLSYKTVPILDAEVYFLRALQYDLKETVTISQHGCETVGISHKREVNHESIGGSRTKFHYSNRYIVDGEQYYQVSQGNWSGEYSGYGSIPPKYMIYNSTFGSYDEPGLRSAKFEGNKLIISRESGDSEVFFLQDDGSLRFEYQEYRYPRPKAVTTRVFPRM